MFYGLRKLNPDDVGRQFAPIYRFLVHKWWFDELYALLFVRPTLRISNWVAAVDKQGIDRAVDGLAWLVGLVARLDEWIDRIFVDGLVDGLAGVTYRGRAFGSAPCRAATCGNTSCGSPWAPSRCSS